MGRQIITSESVSEGHPDKVCDRISDAILDAYLSADDSARIACETVASTDFVLLAGEIKSAAPIANDRLETIVREAVREIGYEQKGFHWRTFAFENRLHEQSPDIAMGVDNHGAGDQGIMFGYACDETPEYMPAAFVYATRIVRTLADLRKSGERPDFGPDAKSQISLVYEDGRPIAAHSIVVSSQHAESLSPEAAREQIMPVIRQCLPDGWISPNTRIHINPTGRFVIGGPDGDAGLTGRKIIVDTYGGAAPHGGGAFSGKDPSKVDRSAAYACRYMAKNIVAAGLAKKCTIQTSYAIGIAEPQSLWIDTHGSQTIDPEKLENTIPDMIDLTPSGIRQALGLNRPIYARTAAYGHFGREPEADGGFSWEKTDLVDALRALA